MTLYEEALRTAAGREAGFQQRLGGIVSHLLGLTRFYSRNMAYRTSAVGEIIARAKIYIDENFRTVTPPAVAEYLCISYSRFRFMFKEYTGFSPAKYILDVRFSKVKEALTNTDLPVKEIAYGMGFQNYDNFFTSFRRTTGMSPLAYRRLTRGQK